MRRAHFGRVDVVEPVIGNHLARDIEDQAAQRVALVGIGVDTPVELLQVLVHAGLDIDQGFAVVAQLFVLLAVDDVGAQSLGVAGVKQGGLDRVLDLLDVGSYVALHLDLGANQVLRQALRFCGIELTRDLGSTLQRLGNFVGIKRFDTAVALDDVGDLRCYVAIHVCLL